MMPLVMSLFRNGKGTAAQPRAVVRKERENARARQSAFPNALCNDAEARRSDYRETGIAKVGEQGEKEGRAREKDEGKDEDVPRYRRVPPWPLFHHRRENPDGCTDRQHGRSVAY